MSFRDENPDYKRLKSEWEAIVLVAHEKGKGTRIDKLDSLMLSSYRFCRCIRSYLREGAVDVDAESVVKVPWLPEAIENAKNTIIKRKGDRGGRPSLFNEADCLEALSRAAYRWLKDNDKLIEIKR